MKTSNTLSDLDTAISSYGCSARLETSAPILAILKDLGSPDCALFERDGLGSWCALAVRFSGRKPLIIAAPSDDPSAGCSIWFAESKSVTASWVAGRIAAISSDADVKFVDAGTGIEVAPQKMRGTPAFQTGIPRYLGQDGEDADLLTVMDVAAG